MSIKNRYPNTQRILKYIFLMLIFNILLSFDSVEKYFTSYDSVSEFETSTIVCLNKSELQKCNHQDSYAIGSYFQQFNMSSKENVGKLSDIIFYAINRPLRINSKQNNLLLALQKIYYNSTLAPPYITMN